MIFFQKNGELWIFFLKNVDHINKFATFACREKV